MAQLCGKSSFRRGWGRAPWSSRSSLALSAPCRGRTTFLHPSLWCVQGLVFPPGSWLVPTSQRWIIIQVDGNENVIYNEIIAPTYCRQQYRAVAQSWRSESQSCPWWYDESYEISALYVIITLPNLLRQRGGF